MAAPPRARLAAFTTGLVAALLFAAPALGSTKQDVTIPMDDGVDIAATLYVPDGTPPTAGWPAIVFLHGLSGNRTQMNALAESYGFVGNEYVVLTFDARGHGASGGLVGIDGPREVADTRAVHDWLAARPEIADRSIGAWGISYGGGAVWNSLAAGVPWAAAEVVETWTDLYSALVPGGLLKSGLVAGLAGSIPDARKSPELVRVQAAAFAGDRAEEVRAFARARSSIDKLAGVRTPVFMMQGRRDFLFGIDQASRAFAKLKGPKRLYIGRHGHPPSTFPAPDTAEMLRQGKQWFDRFLRGVKNGIDTDRRRVVLANATGTGNRSFVSIPRAAAAKIVLPGTTAMRPLGKVVRTSTPTASQLEVFGAPRVRATVTTSGGWSRLVAVLAAKPPRGAEIVVAAGGAPTRNGTHTVSIALGDQATVVPKGSRLRLYLGTSSLVQSPGNILYLALPTPPGARATVGDVTVVLPFLKQAA